MARPARGRGQPSRRLSGEGDGIHPELDGSGERARGSRARAGTADSTRPLDATRELATTAGSLTYAQVSERLAAKVADCLDELFDTVPSSITITSEALRQIHLRIGRILLVALAYRLGLPPIDPAAQGADAQEYFSALRAADNGDLLPLREIWLDRLSGRHLEGRP